jgi:hypothetical protein
LAYFLSRSFLLSRPAFCLALEWQSCGPDQTSKSFGCFVRHVARCSCPTAYGSAPVFWDWRLAAAIFLVNGLGDVAQIFMGHLLEGGIGVAAAGTILFYLSRPNVRAGFV